MKSKIKHRARLLAAAVMLCCTAIAEQPNVIFILADDLGSGDVSYLNSESRIQTPHIDALAAGGIHFTDAHSSSAVCSPTRYGILTGRYNWRSRLKKSIVHCWGDPLIRPEDNRMTVANLFKDAGYQTACIGKWHLGWNWPFLNQTEKEKRDHKEQRASIQINWTQPITGGPTELGFDYYFGDDVPNYPPYCFIENDRTVGIPSLLKPDDMFGTPGPMLEGWKLESVMPAITDKAVQWIDKRAGSDAPFFLYFPLTAPHTPIVPVDEFKGRTTIGPYGDYVEQVDHTVGQIVEALERNGICKDTLIFFTSDNGCSPYAQRTNKGAPEPVHFSPSTAAGHYPSLNLRGHKADIYEGGHRVPFIINWPGKINPGQTSRELVCTTDFMRTCADILEIKLPDSAAEDSISLQPLMYGKKKGARRNVVNHSIHGAFAFRTEKWKLCFCPGSGGWSPPSQKNLSEAAMQKMPQIQLFNLEADIGEQVNVADQHPEIVEQLTAQLKEQVAAGRSTPGLPQKNDSGVNIHLGQYSQETP